MSFMAAGRVHRQFLTPAIRTLFLVGPPQRGLLEGFSSGLIAIANFVRQHDPATAIQLLDLTLHDVQELAEPVSEALLTATGRVFVGITGTTASYQNMLATARAFKELQPSCIVVLGGHHVTPQDDIVLSAHQGTVDFVVRGEGEFALTALLKSYPDITAVPNLSFLERGMIRRNDDAPLMQTVDLDALAPTFDHQRPRAVAGKFDHLTYVSARGCPLSCAFCAVRATAIRTKSIEAIVHDLRYLVEIEGYTELAIEDNFFAHQPKRTLALCRAIEALRKELSFTWDCQTRVESMRRADVVDAMARAGCTAAYLGVESLVHKHLQYLHKTTKADVYLQTLETGTLPTMFAAGIDAYLNLQLGLPGETVADRVQTIETLERLGELAEKNGRQITIFPQLNVIYPGTPHFEMAVEKGYFGTLGREVFEHFTAWEVREQPILNYLGEHFAHGVGGIPLGLLDLQQLAADRFAISAAALFEVTMALRRMEDLPGIYVFRYGQYLAKVPTATRRHVRHPT